MNIVYRGRILPWPIMSRKDICQYFLHKRCPV